MKWVKINGLLRKFRRFRKLRTMNYKLRNGNYVGTHSVRTQLAPLYNMAHRVRRYIARLLSVVRNSQSCYLVTNQQFTFHCTVSCCKLTFFTHYIYFRLKGKMLSALPDGQTLVLWLAASGALLHCTNMHGRDATSAEGCQTMRGRTACARNWHHC